MARFLSGINGPVIGKVGTVVGATWKGQPYVRSRPVKRVGEKTKGEAANQSRFSKMHYWLRPIIGFLRVGFRGYTTTVEGFNAAKSVNLKNAFREENGRLVIDPALVQVSWGDLPLPEEMSVMRSTDKELQFSWDPSKPNKNCDDHDQVMLLAYDPKNKECHMKQFGQFRNTGSDFLGLATGTSEGYHTYIAFISQDRTRQSKSTYLGYVQMKDDMGPIE